MLSAFHDSRDRHYKTGRDGGAGTVSGAVPEGSSVCLTVDVYDDFRAETEMVSASVLFERRPCGEEPAGTPDGGETAGQRQTQAAEEILPMRCTFRGEVETDYGRRRKFVFTADTGALPAGVYFYRFAFLTVENGAEKRFFYGNGEQRLGGFGRQYEAEGACPPFQITVYREGQTVPVWFRKGILYQIFPDRFFRGADAMSRFKPGTFVYGSWEDMPMYIKDPETGDIARWDFFGGNLMGVAEKLPYIESLGASVIYLNPIFEAASNHRYDTCDYLHVDSLLGGDAAFDLLVAAGRREGIRIMLDGVFSHTGSDSLYFDAKGRFGGGAYGNPDSRFRSWYRFGETDDVYECWWGVKVMPNVEELDPGYLDYTVRSENSVVRHWIRKGASGWRLDVADELPDRFIRELRSAAEEEAAERGEEAVILGEVWEDASNKVSYGELRRYFTDRELHTVTNYPFRRNLLEFLSGEADADFTRERFLSLWENYPVQNLYALVNMTGTHDVERLMTVLLEKAADGDRETARQLVKAYAAVLFTFTGVPLIYYGDETCLEGKRDPDNRRTYPWGRQDWEMIRHFSSLAALRKQNAVLTDGLQAFLPAGRLLAFVRFFEGGRETDAFGESHAGGADTEYRRIVCLAGGRNETGKPAEVRTPFPGEQFEILASGDGGSDADSAGAPGRTVCADENGTVRIGRFSYYLILGARGQAENGH